MSSRGHVDAVGVPGALLVFVRRGQHPIPCGAEPANRVARCTAAALPRAAHGGVRRSPEAQTPLIDLLRVDLERRHDGLSR